MQDRVTSARAYLDGLAQQILTGDLLGHGVEIGVRYHRPAATGAGDAADELYGRLCESILVDLARRRAPLRPEIGDCG